MRCDINNPERYYKMAAPIAIDEKASWLGVGRAIGVLLFLGQGCVEASRDTEVLRFLYQCR